MTNFNDWRSIRDNLTAEQIKEQYNYLRDFFTLIDARYLVTIITKAKSLSKGDEIDIMCKTISKLFIIISEIKNKKFKIWQE